jgi:hypothetical protein
MLPLTFHERFAELNGTLCRRLCNERISSADLLPAGDGRAFLPQHANLDNGTRGQTIRRGAAYRARWKWLVEGKAN